MHYLNGTRNVSVCRHPWVDLANTQFTSGLILRRLSVHKNRLFFQSEPPLSAFIGVDPSVPKITRNCTSHNIERTRHVLVAEALADTQGLERLLVTEVVVFTAKQITHESSSGAMVGDNNYKGNVWSSNSG